MSKYMYMSELFGPDASGWLERKANISLGIEGVKEGQINFELREWNTYDSNAEHIGAAHPGFDISSIGKESHSLWRTSYTYGPMGPQNVGTIDGHPPFMVYVPEGMSISVRGVEKYFCKDPKSKGKYLD